MRAADPVHPGCLLWSAGGLSVFERWVAVDGGPQRAITADSRARMEASVGPRAEFIGGWAATLCGALVFWLAPEPVAKAAAALLMLLGGYLVQDYLAQCVTTLWLQNGADRCELACRSEKLGDDVAALHAAQQALMHAAARLSQPIGAARGVGPVSMAVRTGPLGRAGSNE